MSSTFFIICLIIAGVLISVHPVLTIPFIAIACLIAAKAKEPSSEGGIILGMVCFIGLVTIVVMVMKAFK